MPDTPEQQINSPLTNNGPYTDMNAGEDITDAGVEEISEKKIHQELATASKKLGITPTHEASLATHTTGDNVEILESPKVGPDDNHWAAIKFENIESLKRGNKPKESAFSKFTSIFTRKKPETIMQAKPAEGELKNAA